MAQATEKSLLEGGDQVQVRPDPGDRHFQSGNPPLHRPGRGFHQDIAAFFVNADPQRQVAFPILQHDLSDLVGQQVVCNPACLGMLSQAVGFPVLVLQLKTGYFGACLPVEKFLPANNVLQRNQPDAFKLRMGGARLNSQSTFR